MEDIESDESELDRMKENKLYIQASELESAINNLLIHNMPKKYLLELIDEMFKAFDLKIYHYANKLIEEETETEEKEDE